jgi:hypothetical protein
MDDPILYITFKDTVSSSNDKGLGIVVENLRNQLLNVADKIKADPETIYHYIRQDLPILQINLSAPIIVSPSAGWPPPQETNNTQINGEQTLIDQIFKDLKKTHKSEAIIKYMVQNSGIDLTVDQIAQGASITKQELTSWLSQTAKKIPAIENTSRGIYKFNPNQLT